VVARPVDLADDIVTIRCPDPQPVLYRLTTWAEQGAHRLDGLELLRPTLEDMFLALTTARAEHG
jgi:hypothetical protein